MGKARYLLLGSLLAACVVAAMVALSPPTDDLDPENPFWNGMSTFAGTFGATTARSPLELARVLDPKRTILFIIGPERALSTSELAVVSSFVKEGGVLVLMDDFGAGNEVLKQLGLSETISGGLLVDPLFNTKNSRMPKATATLEGRRLTLCLNYASTLTAPKRCVLAWSSEFSFLDLNGDGKRDENEKWGPFPVVASVRLGRGKVVLVSDSSPLINAMINSCDNMEFARLLIGERTPVVYAGLWERGYKFELRRMLRNAFSLMGSFEARLVTALAIACVAVYLYGSKAQRQG